MQPKIRQISFGGWAPPKPAGGAYSAPIRPLTGFWGGGLLLRGEGKGREENGMWNKGGVREGGIEGKGLEEG